MIGKRTLALVLALASLSTPAFAKEETIRSKVPQTSIDAFMKDCKAEVSDATCWCMVKTLASTRDGDFVLDVASSTKLSKGASEAKRKEDLLQLLNRHGLKGSEAKTILEKSMQPLLENAARTCD